MSDAHDTRTSLSLWKMLDALDDWHPCRHPKMHFRVNLVVDFTMDPQQPWEFTYVLECDRCGLTVSEADLEHVCREDRP